MKFNCWHYAAFDIADLSFFKAAFSICLILSAETWYSSAKSWRVVLSSERYRLRMISLLLLSSVVMASTNSCWLWRLNSMKESSMSIAICGHAVSAGKNSTNLFLSGRGPGRGWEVGLCGWDGQGLFYKWSTLCYIGMYEKCFKNSYFLDLSWCPVGGAVHWHLHGLSLWQRTYVCTLVQIRRCKPEI